MNLKDLNSMRMGTLIRKWFSACRYDRRRLHDVWQEVLLTNNNYHQVCVFTEWFACVR